MGCFSYACGISGLTIGYDDPVYFMLLNQNPYADENIICYPTDLWYPRTFPLAGNYNDYGGVDRIEDGPAMDLWMAGLQFDLVEREVGENYIHDVATPKTMTFDELTNAALERRLQYKYLDGPKTPAIEHVMIRQDVWNGICAIPVDGHTVDERVAEITEEWTKVKEWNDLRDKLKARPIAELLGSGTINLLADRPEFGYEFGQDLLLRRHGLGRHFRLAVTEYEKIVDPEARKQATSILTRRAAELTHISRVLGRTRFKWQPSYSSGPQCAEWDIESAVQNVFAGVAAAELKQYEEENEE